jgi:hypothetical protein
MPASADAAANAASRCELICIDPARVADFWPHVAPLIRAAMVRGRITDFTEVARAVFAGDALVWIAWDNDAGAIRAAAVTQLSAVDGTRFCTVVACGAPGSSGDRSDWLPLLAGLERYARQENCKAIRIFGRRGWERVLPDYKPARVLLEKELN